MNNIFENLIKRHEDPVGQIKPRLPGIYEPDWNTPFNFHDSKTHQFDFQEKEENSETFSSDDGLNYKVNKIKKKSAPITPINNTISNSEFHNKNLRVEETENHSLSMNNRGDFQKSKNSKKPVSKMESKNQKNSEKKDQEIKKDAQKSDINIFHIKPKFGVTSFKRNDISRSNFSGEDKNANSNQSEEQVTSPGKQVNSGHTDSHETKGLKLPNHFNQWMNEPVKQSQPKRNEMAPSHSIKVNIGQIEVRAIMEPNKTQESRKPAFKPKLSLDDYLNQRNGKKQ